MTVPHPERISPNMARKGRRLHRDNKIHRVHDAVVWMVQGDHDTYLVVTQGDHATCTCPHHGTCSHIVGVLHARKSATPAVAAVTPLNQNRAT